MSTSGIARHLKAQKVYRVTDAAAPINVRRWIVVDTCVGTLVNAFIPSGVIWFIGLPPPQSWIGPRGMLPAVVAATVLPIFLMTLSLTYVLRRRLATHRAAAPHVKLKHAFSLLALPVLPRALTLTLLGLVVLAPAAAAFLHLEALLPMTRYQFVLFNIGYGAVIGIVMTPLVVLATLAEKP